MSRITIIGGGASGTLLAINLIKHIGSEPLTVNLIEKSGEVGRGIAYGTSKDFHLLNVPAAKMGAFPDAVEHFHQWLGENGYDYAPGGFVPRKIYGQYLRGLFRETIANKKDNVQVKSIKSKAVDILKRSDETKVLLDNGEEITTDKVVLAFGNFLPPNVRTQNDDYTRSPRYFQSPWRADIPEAIDRDERVLIIGTGLTGIDVILSLYNHNHRGKIYALSTHGLLPAVHAQTDAYPSFRAEIEAETTIRGLLKAVRRHLKKAEADGGNWRAVIDSLRSLTQETWYRLPLEEKRRFMRHLQRRWDVARHRMPPECFEILQNLQAAGKLEILRGKIRSIESMPDGGFQITFGKDNQATADRIINCTGSQSNYAKIDEPLVKNLIARGEIKPDALRIGLEAAPTGEIINERGEISDSLYTFATAQKGILWECTAMPDIRGQAEQLSFRLLENPTSKI